MPSNWLAIDTNFPTFTGEEPVDEQIKELVNYLYQLRESLQYSLQNLTTDNFNAAALESLSEEAKGEIGQQLQKIGNELTQLAAQVKTIEGRISGVDALSGQVETNKDDITALKDRMDNAESDLVALQAWGAEQEAQTRDIAERLQKDEEELADLKTASGNTEQQITALSKLIEDLDTDVALLISAVEVAGDGSATVGAEGKDLHLIGNVYINGVLFTGGTT